MKKTGVVLIAIAVVAVITAAILTHNPLITYDTAAEMRNDTGINIPVPSSSSDVEFAAHKSGDIIAQASFTHDNLDCELRGADASIKGDFTGMDYDWTIEKSINVDNVFCSIKLVPNEAALVEWEADETTTFYALSVTGDDTSVENITTLLEDILAQ